MERIIMIIALVFAFSSIAKGCNKTDASCTAAHYAHGATGCD